MSSPRSSDAGAPLRARTLVAVVAAALLSSSLVTAPVRAAGPEEVPKELRQAKKELRATKEKVRAGNQEIRTLQRQMNRLATSIARTQDRLHHAHERIRKLQRKITELETEAAALQDELDERNREAYMMGTAPVLYVLTASSAAEAAARLGFLDEMNRRDEILALELAVATGRIASARTAEARAWQVTEIGRLRLEADRMALEKKMATFQHLVTELNIRVEEIQDEISKMRPFSVCPIDGPHAIADDFGIWVHRSKERGGDHIHQGNDIYAAEGTPIVAPFEGIAVDSTNRLGGLAVSVYGEYGYVYNAHMSLIGQLGPVEKGDVIGYVGATGNAGGPHDHFEWHPDEGKAVDPHDFLMMICSGPPMTF
jgi:murein DD-endopeptidase MepM/ murein hydrolase activator NlpD